jgi:hypothetical protein
MALLFRFSQLRNSILSSCPARLRMPHAGLSSGKLLDPKSYERHLFSTRVQETASLDRTCISRIQPLKFQQTSEHEQSVPLLIFDIETTGFFQKHNRITEFAVRDLFFEKVCLHSYLNTVQAHEYKQARHRHAAHSWKLPAQLSEPNCTTDPRKKKITTTPSWVLECKMHHLQPQIRSRHAPPCLLRSSFRRSKDATHPPACRSHRHHGL